jgi:hypothetical protein
MKGWAIGDGVGLFEDKSLSVALKTFKSLTGVILLSN